MLVSKIDRKQDANPNRHCRSHPHSCDNGDSLGNKPKSAWYLLPLLCSGWPRGHWRRLVRNVTTHDCRFDYIQRASPQMVPSLSRQVGAVLGGCRHMNPK